MQCACAVLSSVDSPGLLYFSIYFINDTIFERKKLLNEHKMCVLIFSKTLETFLILRRVERDMIKNVYLSSCKIPVVLLRF
jgi:hypothetical protein